MTDLLSQAELEIIASRSGGRTDIATLMECAAILTARLATRAPDQRRGYSLGPLTAVDLQPHYIVEITMKQKRAS